MTANACRLLRCSRPLLWHFNGIKQLPKLSITSKAFQLVTVRNVAKLSNLYRYNNGIVPQMFLTINRYNHNEPPAQEEEKKPGVFQRFKQMYRDYWYVLIPVHVVTSIGWFGGFYYLAKSGVDLVSFVESLNISESLVDKLKKGNSTAGYIAISYALYKIFTPLRYTVTIGGTTFAINYLQKRGLIKPVPNREEFRKMVQLRNEKPKPYVHPLLQQDCLKPKKETPPKDKKPQKEDINNPMNKVKKLPDHNECTQEERFAKKKR